MLPTAVFGPFVPNFKVAFEAGALGTNLFLYQLLDAPGAQFPPNPFGHIVDVRDVARIHVLALSSRSSSSTSDAGKEENKLSRLIANASTFTWPQVTSILRDVDNKEGSKGLVERLPGKDAEVVMPQMCCPLDTSRTEKVTGFKEYRTARETVVDTFESLLDWEKEGKMKVLA